MIKKLVAVIGLAIYAATSANAFEVVTTSTLKGPQGVLINNITELAKKSNMDIVAKQTGGCGESVSYFHSATDPVGIIWSDSMYRNSVKSKQNCVVDFAKAKAIAVTFAPYDICVKKGVVLKPGSKLLFGNNKFNPQDSQLEHMNANNMNITFKTVTYGGSGPALTGLVNSEVDIAMIATSVASSAISAGSIDCPYSTGSTRYGQRPLSELTGDNPLSGYSLGMMLLVRNMSDNDMAALEKSLAELGLRLEPQDMVGTKVGVDSKTVDKFIEGAKLQLTWK
jgi:hypothetical protein